MRFSANVGHFDAVSRRVLGACALIAGLAGLDMFFWSMGFLTWILYALMIALGLFYITGGFRGGAAVFGLLLIAIALSDGWLALHHEGAWALLLGAVVGAIAFTTAEVGWCPINSMLGKDTHSADQAWSLPHPAH